MASVRFARQCLGSYPARTVLVGGVPKAELRSRLLGAGVLLNEAAEALFDDARFTTASASSYIETVQVPVAALGFQDGATFAEIIERAASNGLLPCPLELGPHLRLQFADQPEGSIGQPASQHCAPPGSITLASEPLADDDDTPKGFYLRRIQGSAWLRGYRSWSGHNWSPQDMFVFMRRHNVS